MPLEFGDVVIARFPWENERRGTRSVARPCLVIRESADEIEVAYGTTSPEYTERYNTQIVRHEPGEIGGWLAGAFILYRRRVLPKTQEFFPEGMGALARLGEAKRARARRMIEEMAAMQKWERAQVADPHGSARP